MAATEDVVASHRPYVPDEVVLPEFTWLPVLVGAMLGIVFGASSLYLVLKVGMTVSASIPVAVLSITLFRLFSRVLGVRRATILENNIVQTTGSAGESIAFGVGVTMPAVMLLGFDMEVGRVMVVSVLGGLIVILMMIPLRRAFIVNQHGLLKYPDGTAWAVGKGQQRKGTQRHVLFLTPRLAPTSGLRQPPGQRDCAAQRTSADGHLLILGTAGREQMVHPPCR